MPLGGREEIICLAIVVSGKAIALVSGSHSRSRILPTKLILIRKMTDCALSPLLPSSKRLLVHEGHSMFRMLRMVDYSTTEPSTRAREDARLSSEIQLSTWGNTHSTHSRSCN